MAVTQSRTGGPGDSIPDKRAADVPSRSGALAAGLGTTWSMDEQGAVAAR